MTTTVNEQNFYDIHREEIIYDKITLGWKVTCKKWKIGVTKLYYILTRWKEEGYNVPLRNQRKWSSIKKKSENEYYAYEDNGCDIATKYLGRQSHCLSLKDREIDMDNSCPFPECVHMKRNSI